MKTILHRNEDGFEIIIGFRDGTIDPVATVAMIQPKLLALPELAKCEGVRTKILAQVDIARNAYAQAEMDLKAGRQVQADAATADYQAALARIPVLEAELNPLADAFEAARARLFEEHAVYFTPGPGEHVLSDADHARLCAKHEALAQGQVLCLDGSVIADNRGRAYWRKGATWTKAIVFRLGEAIPSGAILEEALSAVQREEIALEAETARIAALKPEEKAAELASRLEAAAREAATKKAMSEITGDAFDARAWYAEEKARFEAVYA